jgi:TctA family transporter
VDALTLLLAVVVFSLLGTMLGAAAGVVPGLHINNVAYVLGASCTALTALALALFPAAAAQEALLLVGAVIVSCLIAHTFTSILPAVFLGAPDPGRALSVLPAHRLLLEGRGVEAVRCSLLGCVGGLAACLLALPLFRVVMGDPVNAYSKLRPFMALILVLIVTLLLVSEPLDRPRGRRCVLVLDRLQSASFALSERERALSCARNIRAWQAPDNIGNRVCVTGVISERREYRGRLSFVLEEGAALDMLVPDRGREDAARIAVGEIVIAEGVVAPPVRSGWGLRRKATAAALFLASGFLGIVVLETGRVLAHNWYPLGAPPVPEATMMFPLFCGLFGLPTLILGILETPATPPQEDDASPLSPQRKLRAVLTGVLAGGVLGWYPGMTSGHGSVLARLFSGEDDGGEIEDTGETDGTAGATRKTGDITLSRDASGGISAARSHGGIAGRAERGAPDDRSTREFLISASSVTVANAFFNIVALFVILRARSGALHMAQQVLGDGLLRWQPAPNIPPEFALLAVAASLAALLAFPLTMLLGRKLARLYGRVPYRRLTASVVSVLLVLLFLFSGVAGLAVTGIAVCIGLIPPLAGVRRVHLMGSILLPVLLYFTGAAPGVMAFLGF